MNLQRKTDKTYKTDKLERQPKDCKISNIFTLLVCSSKSSIAEATSGTTEETSPGTFLVQTGILKCTPEESTFETLAFLLVKLDSLASSLRLSFLLPINSADEFLRSCNWLGHSDELLPNIVWTACVGYWLVVHSPASWSSAVTSFGQNWSRVTTLFCQTVRS